MRWSLGLGLYYPRFFYLIIYELVEKVHFRPNCHAESRLAGKHVVNYGLTPFDSAQGDT